MTTACAGPRALPAERGIGLGFEDVIADEQRWQELGPQLSASGANAVSLAVGRVDWTAFAWEAHPEAAIDAVTDQGRDLVAETLTRVSSLMGAGTAVTLVIDALAPRLLAESPELAGVAEDGRRSEEFASVSALESGPVGERLVALAEHLALRYRPDRIGLTELMFDASTFGEDDLASYRGDSGAQDWPRRADGSIDTEHPSLGVWRSSVLTTLLSRVREAVAAHGVAVEVDVRAPQDDPDGDRPLSGHDYEMLLTAVDRLMVWNYFGLHGLPPAFGGQLAASLERRFPGRCAISTGLWSADGVLTPGALADGLDAVSRAGSPAVAVTPASLLEAGHWRTLHAAWVNR